VIASCDRRNDLERGLIAKAHYNNEICETHPETTNIMSSITARDCYQLYRPLEENEIRILEILSGLKGDIIRY